MSLQTIIERIEALGAKVSPLLPEVEALIADIEPQDAVAIAAIGTVLGDVTTLFNQLNAVATSTPATAPAIDAAIVASNVAADASFDAAAVPKA